MPLSFVYAINYKLVQRSRIVFHQLLVQQGVQDVLYVHLLCMAGKYPCMKVGGGKTLKAVSTQVCMCL